MSTVSPAPFVLSCPTASTLCWRTATALGQNKLKVKKFKPADAHNKDVVPRRMCASLVSLPACIWALPGNLTL